MDTACVEFGSGENELLSKNQLWTVKHRMHRKFHQLKYDVKATKGEIILSSKFWFVTFNLSNRLVLKKKIYNVFSLKFKSV